MQGAWRESCVDVYGVQGYGGFIILSSLLRCDGVAVLVLSRIAGAPQEKGRWVLAFLSRQLS